MSVLERPPVIDAVAVLPMRPRLARHQRPGGRPATSTMIILACALIGIAALHVINLNGWPTFLDDEGTYAAQSWAVYQGALAHYAYWYDHPPGGWLQLAAITGVPALLGIEPTIEVARYVMVGCTLASSALIFQLCRNLGMHLITSVSGMVLWGLSPLVVFEGRQVMLDNMALPWALGAFVLATSRQQTLWQHIGAGALFGVAVLTKETTVLLAPALLMALWVYSYRPTRVFNAIGAVVTAAVLISIYPLYAVLKNELISGEGHVSLQDAISFQLVNRVGSGRIWDPSSGARDIVESWLSYDVVVPIFGVLAGFGCLWFRSLRPVGLAVSVMVLMALRPDGYLPWMYIIGLLPFATIALVGLAERAAVALRALQLFERPAGTALVVVIALLSLGYLVPGWIQRNAVALTNESNDSYYAALSYMEDNLDRDSQIIVDDSYWLNLVNAGWSADGWNGPIWYFKLDLDPIARTANLSNGWRDAEYLVVNDGMLPHLDPESKPQLVAAYTNSSVIGEWGTGEEKVQLRRIVPGADPESVPDPSSPVPSSVPSP